MRYPAHLLKCIEVLKKLPGVGRRSAERYAFEMLSWDPRELYQMAAAIQQIPEKIQLCPACGCLSEPGICYFCSKERAATKKLCIIASPRDAFAIDETDLFKGLFHVISALLSPIDGTGPEAVKVPHIIERINEHAIEEVIIAIDSTLEGDATSLFLKGELEQLPIKISRLAFGLPMGSRLDYVDGGTLAQAFYARSNF